MCIARDFLKTVNWNLKGAENTLSSRLWRTPRPGDAPRSQGARRRPARLRHPARAPRPSRHRATPLLVGTTLRHPPPRGPPNATRQALEIPGAKHERRLFPVACTRLLEPAEPIRRSTAVMRNGKNLHCTSGFSKKHCEGKTRQSDTANLRSPLNWVATWGFAHPL